jgi:exosortase
VGVVKPLSISGLDGKKLAPALLAGLAFFLLFLSPIQTLLRDWWNDPEAAHGLLLGPLALWLAWRKGISPEAVPRPVPGLVILTGAVLLRYASELAAELYTMRLALLMALVALSVFLWGYRQTFRFWLPAGLLFLSVPLPDVILSTLAFPLQLRASEIGAALLAFREVPVNLAGNVIHLPGQTLFVTEACSGLRSLTALLALGLLLGGLWLRHPLSRVLLLFLSIPVAILINGFRVFLTGFLVFFLDPAIGRGFMHLTEGWILFLVAFLILGGLAWVGVRMESMILRRGKITPGVRGNTSSGDGGL